MYQLCISSVTRRIGCFTQLPIRLVSCCMLAHGHPRVNRGLACNNYVTKRFYDVIYDGHFFEFEPLLGHSNAFFDVIRLCII